MSERGTAAIDDSARLASGDRPVSAVGVDETAYLRATATHATTFATGIVDLHARGGRPGCSMSSRGAQAPCWPELLLFQAAAGMGPVAVVVVGWSRLNTTRARRRLSASRACMVVSPLARRRW
jgi:hypothetical protein